MNKIDKEDTYFFQLHTGSGKTRIMVEFIKQHPEKTFLILVPTLLLSQ
jgi:superfamily II DNA or RNA helicase